MTISENNHFPQQESTPASSGQRQLIIKKKQLFIIITIFCVLLVGFILSALIHHKTHPQANQADELLHAGKYSDAAANAAEGLKTNPSDKSLLLSELRALGAQGNLTGTEKDAFQKAQRYIADALSYYGDDPDVLSAVGYLYEISGQYDKALDFYNKSIQQDPTNSNAYFHRGHTYQFLDKQAEASADYDKSYSLDSGNPLVLIAKGNQVAATQETDKAISFYKQAADSDEATVSIKAEALTDEALMQQQKLYIKTSVETAKQATITEPAYAPAWAIYGYSVGLAGDTKAGTQSLAKAISLLPNRAVDYWMKGVTERAGGDYSASAIDFSTGLTKVDSDNTILGFTAKAHMKAQILYDMAKSLTMQHANKPKETVNLIQAAIQLNPDFKQYFLFDYQKVGFYKDIASSSEFKTFLANL